MHLSFQIGLSSAISKRVFLDSSILPLKWENHNQEEEKRIQEILKYIAFLVGEEIIYVQFAVVFSIIERKGRFNFVI